MHGGFLQDLAVVMIVAGLVTVLCRQLRQPVVLGYIAAGVLIGPFTKIPFFVRDRHTVQIMAELGVILLMFSLGLHFSLRKLASVGMAAIVAATLEILLMLLIGYAVGRLFGWNRMDSLFLGAILSISSTTIITKALSDMGLVKERFAELVFGILVVEDILAIALIALLSGVAVTGSLAPGEVMHTFGRLGLFLTAVLVAGLLAVPPLLRYLNRFRSNEMMLIASLGLCFGVSLLALNMGYSVALGAFLVGAIVAEAREHGKVESLVEPVRDMFSAMFFVAVGMMIDPHLMMKYWLPITVITAAVVLGKVLTCAFGAFAAGNDLRTSVRVGMGLAQIGEFSFIIATMGRSTDPPVTSDFLYPIAVTVSAITTLLTPYLIRASDPVADGFVRLAPRGVAAYIEVYSRWMSHHGTAARGETGNAKKLLRRWTLQMALNGTLAAAVLVAGSTVARRTGNNDPFVDSLPAWTGRAKTVIWLAEMVLVLPLLVVSYQKLRAFARVMAELLVPRAEAGDHTGIIRGLVSKTIMVTGVALILMSVLVMSIPVLPPWPVLLALLGVMGVLMALMWRHLEDVYDRAQIALTETLTRPAEAPAAKARPPLPGLLRDAAMETVVVCAGSGAAGKLIRELALRTQTGASIVGIGRAGESIISPGPDEELQPGDSVMIIGTRAHLRAARPLFVGRRAEDKIEPPPSQAA
jgi:CPA2 family monovalent cation:H+ antiporter-2